MVVLGGVAVSYERGTPVRKDSFFFLFSTLGPELSDTKFHELQIRALLGTTSHYCGTAVLQSRTVPSGTALGLRSQGAATPYHNGGFERNLTGHTARASPQVVGARKRYVGQG